MLLYAFFGVVTGLSAINYSQWNKMMLTRQDRDKLAKWSRRQVKVHPLRLIKNGDDRVKSLQTFCDTLNTAVPSINVRVDSDENASLPGIRMGDNITYHAVPAGPELEPFLQVLEAKRLPLSDALQQRVDLIEAPAHIRVFIAPNCLFCPRAVQKLIPLAAATPMIQLEIIDGALFEDEAESAAIQSAPTTLLDNQYRWVGLPPVQEILHLILDRDPSQLGQSALRGMIEEGKAADLACIMAADGKIFPAFIDLLIHEKWPVRLGAMACFEYLVESDPNLAARYIDPLWDRFQHSDDQIRGDIAYLMGESKCSEAKKHLDAISGGDYPDELKDAAREGLETLNGENSFNIES
jgi:Thioredoxin domain